MEYLKFPMQYLRISQGENTGSHLGTYAMDLAGRDTGKDPVYAPCSGTVVRIRSNANGELYLWSDGDVRCPDGYTGPVTVTLIHDETFNVRQGQHVVQGAHIYDEGGMGHGHPGAYGAHCHMEIVKGHVQPYQTRNAQGSWRTPGQMMHLYDALWVGGDVPSWATAATRGTGCRPQQGARTPSRPATAGGESQPSSSAAGRCATSWPVPTARRSSRRCIRGT